jgi:hypothetical protein
MKRILTLLSALFVCQFSFASNNSLLFNIASTGNQGPVSITLCLNAKGPLSCQNYTVTGSSLNITTAIPNQTYTSAGIIINTPGYALGSNVAFSPVQTCIPYSNGYCLFSANNAKATRIFIRNTSGPVG